MSLTRDVSSLPTDDSSDDRPTDRPTEIAATSACPRRDLYLAARGTFSHISARRICLTTKSEHKNRDPGRFFRHPEKNPVRAGDPALHLARASRANIPTRAVRCCRTKHIVHARARAFEALTIARRREFAENSNAHPRGTNVHFSREFFVARRVWRPRADGARG